MPPHFTLYNQTSGYSTFHFLPLLLGLYATHVGRLQGPTALASLLDVLHAKGIGECCTIGAGQMLLILPFGAHGVFVPRPSANPSLRPFELSMIRAAELYVAPVCDAYEHRLREPDWNQFLDTTPEERTREAALLQTFAARQADICTELGVSRNDWLYLATLLQRRWDAEQPTADGSDAEDEGGA